MPLASLWLAVLLSVVIVFVATSIIHMVSLRHKNDKGQKKRRRPATKVTRRIAIAPPGLEPGLF